MASKLASQLQTLAVAGGGSTHSRPSIRPSLLFGPTQAADIDLRTIFTLSQTGLDELVATDGRFKAFKKTLFSLESSQLDRELQSKDYNEKLNKSISTYLRLLSGYVMLTSAHQTLEYLIRRYKIQVYNVEDIILCILPYHETSLFVRIVQLLQIKNSRWQFLEGVQNSGAAPPRAVLVQQCMSDMAVLEAICESAMAVSGVAAKSRTSISFTCVVLVETLAEVSVVSTDLVNRILPFIMHSFENGIAEEYRVGSLMVIGALANRATLVRSLVETLFDYICRAFQKGAESEAASVNQLHIMVMIQLVQTQEIDTFPSKAFKTLVKVRDFIPVLSDLVKIFRANKFIELLVQATVEHCLQHEHYEHALLHAIKSLPVGSQVVSLVLRLLEISFGEGSKTWSAVEVTKARNVVKNVLQALEKQFPTELDKAMSLHFQQSEGRHKGKKEEDPVYLFLSEVFHGSLHAPLVETHTSLYLSLDHPQASVREAAVKQLAKITLRVNPSNGPEIDTVLREVYLRRLSDDDYRVVYAVLSVEGLVNVLPAERLFHCLTSIITRCKAALVAGEASKEVVNNIVKLVTELIVTEFLLQHPSFMEEVASLFLDYLFLWPLTWKLNKSILKAAARVPFHLFTDLENVLEETTSVTDKESKSKGKGKLWRAATNGRIIKSLSLKLADDPTALLPLLKSNLRDNLRLLLVILLIQCFKQQCKAFDSKIFHASLCWLRDEWASKGVGKTLPLAELQTVDYTSWDDSTLTFPDFYHKLEAKENVVYLELLLRALYYLTTCVSPKKMLKPESDGEQTPLDNLFVFYAGSTSMKIFRPHIEHLVSGVSAPGILSFLSKFFIVEESAVPVFVQAHSLDVLALWLLNTAGSKPKAGNDLTYSQLQHLLPPVLVALASPLKAVRKSAISCVQHLLNAWNDHGLALEKGATQVHSPLLSPSDFQEILEALVGVGTMVISSGTYLGEFFREKYGPTKLSMEDEPAQKRHQDDHQSIVEFYVSAALLLPVYGQWVLFKVLQGIAHGAELVHAAHARLNQLVDRRKVSHLLNSSEKTCEKLTEVEIQLLGVLLQMYTPEVAVELSQGPGADGKDLLSPLFECLTVEGVLVDPAVLQPCSAALNCLTPDFYCALDTTAQDTLFQSLVSLFTVKSETVRSATHGVLRRIRISASTVARHVEYLLEEGMKVEDMERKEKRMKVSEEVKIGVHKKWSTPGKLLSSTTAILELLLWKSEMGERKVLLAPLFKLLRNVLSGVWPQLERDGEVLLEGNTTKDGKAAAVLNIQHLILMVLDSIVRTLSRDGIECNEMVQQEEFDVDVVVLCVNKAGDGTTRNHALALLTSLGRLIPDAVLKHLISVLSVVGESTLTQDDTHSHEVLSHLLTAIVPSWLAMEQDPTSLLEVFVNALLDIPVHRRMAVITNLLRVTSEEVSLHIFLFLLLEKASRTSKKGNDSSYDQTTNVAPPMDSWDPSKSLELEFATSLCRQYSPAIMLPAMVKLLGVTKADDKPDTTVVPDKSSRRSAWALQQLATQFVADQLKSSELYIGMQLHGSSNVMQKSLVGLMEHILVQLQTLGRVDILPQKFRKAAQQTALVLLDRLTTVMASTAYIKGISSLMKHPDKNIQRKVLQMYTLKLKDIEQSANRGQSKKKQVVVLSSQHQNLAEEELELHIGVVKDIVELLAGKGEEAPLSTRHAAIEALNVSAKRFAEKLPDVFASSLAALIDNCRLKYRSLAAAALRCVATILAKLGPHALPALPETVSALFEIAEQALAATPSAAVDSRESEEVPDQSALVVAFLEALEAIIDKLGGFLTPYLEKIVSLVLLQPQLIAASDADVAVRAAAVRALLPARIPGRLLLEPLLSTYGKAVQAGRDSTCALFHILSAMTTKADKSFVAAYHGRIFQFCLTAFDLRHGASLAHGSISEVETAVVTTVVSLVMKLSETTFKPLFVKILEWAESEVEGNGVHLSQSVDRNIVFYKLVNQLAGRLRSVFVPYLQYLINGSLHHLTERSSERETSKPKKKKNKKQGVNNEWTGSLTLSEWHLRHLILCSLHKFFLYDTISFLDAPKFQLLLEPIVAQLVVDAPPEVPSHKSNEESTELPSVEEMDDVLVSCLGQLALTAGTDLLWKPLNHEVLMRTRVENTRTRLLALRVVKFLAEHLKEDYLVLLPETIPFLAELLEDTELTVLAETQEVVKILEELSGEDLAQYF